MLWDGKYTTTQGKGAVTFYRNVYIDNTKGVRPRRTPRPRCSTTTFYRTGTVKTQSHSTFYIKKGSITVRNSIIRGSAGYHFYAASGAKITVTYPAYWITGLGTRNSSSRVVLGTGARHMDPGILSYDPNVSSYLMTGPGSASYKLGSSGGPVGALWR